jgi:hypothetical protein
LVDRDDQATMIVARKIIELAKAGESDPVKLRDGALKALGVHYSDRAHRG